MKPDVASGSRHRAEHICQDEARRIALAAQGFGTGPINSPQETHLLETLDRLHLYQIDSVNAVVRAHYLPAFARLGGYDRGDLDRIAWGTGRERKLFEYRAHEASLLPFAMHPLLRWRMERADRGTRGWARMRAFATERRAESMALLDRFRSDGPLAAADFESHKAQPGWWNWSDTKCALEWLFAAGHITTATRRGVFERVYDLTERVIPPEVLALPTPEPIDAHRRLIARAAAALGIATSGELRDYFRQSSVDAGPAIQSLVEEGVLSPVEVPGWPAAWLHRDVRRPLGITAQALLAPFDPLIWERDRTERLFGFRYRLEIYVPKAKRRYGYYVLPFLLGDRLVARVDLKADRKRSRLDIVSTHLEPDAPDHTAAALETELQHMAAWLGLG